jgi:hypothetical protein
MMDEPYNEDLWEDRINYPEEYWHKVEQAAKQWSKLPEQDNVDDLDLDIISLTN